MGLQGSSDVLKAFIVVVQEVLLELKRGDLRRKVMIKNDCADRVLLIVLRRAIITCFPHFWLPLRALAAKYSS